LQLLYSDYEKYTNYDIILCRLSRQKFYVLGAYVI